MRGLLRVSRYATPFAVVITMIGFALLPGIAGAASEPDITAKYAVVIDADTGQVLLDKGMNTPVAPASLTKIFTAAVALDSAHLDKTVTVDTYDLVGEASMGLYPGAELTLHTLLYGLMLPSGNDAAMTIARSLGELPGDTPQQSVNRFMERVNATAARLGLEHTNLSNPHGLDQPGHETSARDVAAMTMYAMRNETFREIIGSSYYQAEGFEFYQANRLLSSAPGVIGGKTGITDNAGYCLVEIAQRDGKTVIAVLLNSTAEAWYSDASTLLDHGFSVLAAGTVPADAPRITLAPAAPAALAAQPKIAGPTGSNLSVDLVGDTMAVVRPVEALGRTDGISWAWPLASLASMGVALVLFFTYPSLLGLAGLLWQQTRTISFGMPVAFAGSVASLAAFPAPSRSKRPRRRSRPVRQEYAATTSVRWSIDRSGTANQDPYRDEAEQVVRLNAAETITARAIRLTIRGDYHAAIDEFVRALRTEPGYDFSRCPGFWTMPTGGFVAASRAYEIVDRAEDARSLLTIVKLSYGSYYDVRTAVDQALRPRH